MWAISLATMATPALITLSGNPIAVFIIIGYIIFFLIKNMNYLDEDPIFKSEIDADTRPIIGLEHICEIQHLEQMPIYSCSLCSMMLPNGQKLIEHTLTLKHRQAFLKVHDPEVYEMIHKGQLKKNCLEEIVEECIISYEKDHGRGKMMVKKEKNKTASSSYKKRYSSDCDSHSNHKYSRHEKSSHSEWGKVSSSGSRDYERKRHSSNYRSDFDIDHYYSKEKPQSRSAYYQTVLGKEDSPPKSVRSTTGSRYYSREEPESRFMYYRRSSVKESSPPKIRSISSSRYSEEEPEYKSSFYQASFVKEISLPEIGRNVDGSRYFSEETPESRSTYYQSAVNNASPPKIMQNSNGSSHVWTDEPMKADLRTILEERKPSNFMFNN
ncbi:hypothetical protein TNCV_3389911 [Trichonephila clavipes]|nr:hypothetical protein TNCV_3389911 [Trichonephila clavipes]